jgi:hypothetical protein
VRIFAWQAPSLTKIYYSSERVQSSKQWGFALRYYPLFKVILTLHTSNLCDPWCQLSWTFLNCIANHVTEFCLLTNHSFPIDSLTFSRLKMISSANENFTCFQYLSCILTLLCLWGVVLGFKLYASHFLGRCYTTRAIPPAPGFLTLIFISVRSLPV